MYNIRGTDARGIAGLKSIFDQGVFCYDVGAGNVLLAADETDARGFIIDFEYAEVSHRF